jgi:nucleotide-binding universal stress UspA family protein
MVVTVIEDLDPMLMADGSGHAGPTLTPKQLATLQDQARSAGEALVQAAVEALGMGGVETRALEGAPGPTLCSFAEEVSAAAIVMGRLGRGRLKRSAPGVRLRLRRAHAPCRVVVTGEVAAGGG